METSYLKAHSLWDRYPEWTPNLYSDRSQDSNPCASGYQGSTVPHLSLSNTEAYMGTVHGVT